jgi:hypothetical protein
MKIPLHRSKFGENLPVKEMLTQSMRQNLTVSQNKSRLPGCRGVRDPMPSICGTGGGPIYAYLNLLFSRRCISRGILGASVFFVFYFLFLQNFKKSNFVG